LISCGETGVVWTYELKNSRKVKGRSDG